MTTEEMIKPKEVLDPFPYKLIRILPDDKSYIVMDTSASSTRLEKALGVWKQRKNKLPGKYVVVHTQLMVVAE